MGDKNQQRAHSISSKRRTLILGGSIVVACILVAIFVVVVVPSFSFDKDAAHKAVENSYYVKKGVVPNNLVNPSDYHITQYSLDWPHSTNKGVAANGKVTIQNDSFSSEINFVVTKISDGTYEAEAGDTKSKPLKGIDFDTMQPHNFGAVQSVLSDDTKNPSCTLVPDSLPSTWYASYSPDAKIEYVFDQKDGWKAADTTDPSEVPKLFVYHDLVGTYTNADRYNGYMTTVSSFKITQQEGDSITFEYTVENSTVLPEKDFKADPITLQATIEPSSIEGSSSTAPNAKTSKKTSFKFSGKDKDGNEISGYLEDDGTGAKRINASGNGIYSSTKDPYLSSRVWDQNNSAQKASFWGYFTKQE